MTDPWAFWDDAIAGKQPVASPDDPQCGFYRLPIRDGYLGKKAFEPVAYYLDDARSIQCRVGSGDNARDLTKERGEELWARVCSNPITEAQYRAVAEEGKLWHDEPALVGMQGHNKPPAPGSLEDIATEVETLVSEAAARLKGPDNLRDQADCDEVANLADRLAELQKLAKEMLAEERKPFKQEVDRVEKKWHPIIEAAEVYKTLKIRFVTPFLQKATRAALEAKKRAAAAGFTVEAERPTAGTRGRAMSLRETRYAKIIDYDAVLHFFRNSQVIRDVVQHEADKTIRNGIEVPGTEVVIESKAV
jgi:hypothetical protein